ncbi:hypothetical protein N9N28_04615 [Rubripirellula amarantea]|nr:hypothetical protein [Rubripirellula amarantea]
MKKLKHQSQLSKHAEAEHFFAELEEKIVQKLHAEATSDDGRRELLRSTGIHDEKLLDEMAKLGITADGVIALRLIPLVLVAWAEGVADQRERTAVIAAATRLGIHEATTAWILLDRWLTKHPPGLCVDAWKRYTHETFAKMSSTAQNRLVELTQKQMIEVAKSSGGHLGIGKISKKEEAIIHQVVTSMRLQAMLQ